MPYDSPYASSVLQDGDGPGIFESWLKVGAFRTRYLACGDRGSPPVILLHDGAWGGCSSVTWDYVIRTLSQHYWVLAPDLLGYGGSDKVVFLDRSPNDFRIEHISEFLACLGETRPIHCIGNSFGGSLALRAAAGSFGINLRSVVSVSGTGGPYRTEYGLTELARWDGTEADMARVVRLMIDDDAPIFESHLARRMEWAMRNGHYRALAAPRISLPTPLAHTQDLPPDDWMSELASSGIPTLLIGGSRDALLESDWMKKFVADVPSAKAVELDCKHAPNVDQPSLFLAALLPFLQAL